jgi:hypothetical protein
VTFDPTPGSSSSAYQFPEKIENNSQTPTENTGQNITRVQMKRIITKMKKLLMK